MLREGEEELPLNQGTFPFADIEAYYQMVDNADRGEFKKSWRYGSMCATHEQGF